jgi:hypothetical protein
MTQTLYERTDIILLRRGDRITLDPNDTHHPTHRVEAISEVYSHTFLGEPYVDVFLYNEHTQRICRKKWHVNTKVVHFVQIGYNDTEVSQEVK